MLVHPYILVVVVSNRDDRDLSREQMIVQVFMKVHGALESAQYRETFGIVRPEKIK